jgi:hypothetical protein
MLQFKSPIKILNKVMVQYFKIMEKLITLKNQLSVLNHPIKQFQSRKSHYLRKQKRELQLRKIVLNQIRLKIYLRHYQLKKSSQKNKKSNRNLFRIKE